MIDKWDLDLAERDPENTLEKRSVRILDALIKEAEDKITHLQFVRETILRNG